MTYRWGSTIPPPGILTLAAANVVAHDRERCASVARAARKVTVPLGLREVLICLGLLFFSSLFHVC